MVYLLSSILRYKSFHCTAVSQQQHDRDQAIVHLLWQEEPADQQKGERNGCKTEILSHPALLTGHKKSNNGMGWPCPEQVEIVAAHLVIGGGPHEDENDAEQAGEKEEQTIEALEEPLYELVLCKAKQEDECKKQTETQQRGKEITFISDRGK